MRTLFGTLWFVLVLVALYLYFFNRDFFQYQLGEIVQTSIYLAYAVLLLIGSIRGFTLVPITYLIILGLLFFPPWPLFVIIILGALVSSASVYYFFKFLDLDTLFEKKYGKEIDRVRQALAKNELPIIIGWSAFPFLPTDVICYICGTLEVDIKKLLLGVFIGESLMSGAYIFFGHYLLGYLHLVV